MPKRKWIICPDCDGEGHNARHLGEINRDEWDDEEFERYMDGGYDKQCTTCGGAGKIRKGDKPKRKRSWMDDPESIAERRMGA